MATQIFNIVRFVAVAPAVPTSLPHGLNFGPRAVIPDFIMPSVPGFTVTADAVNVTVTNNGIAAASIDCWCLAIHTHSRAFGAVQTTVLTPQPFVPSLDPTSAALSAPRTCFVFRPGGVAGANVYTDWATLMAAVGTVAGEKEICLDDSIVSPIVIPSSAGAPGGVWNLTDVAVVGLHYLTNGNQTPVDISDGAVLTSSAPVLGGFATVQRYKFANVALRKAGGAVTTPITLTGASTVGLVELTNAQIGNTAGGSVGVIVAVVAPVLAAAIVLERSSSIDDASVFVVDVGAGSALSVFAFEGARVDDNTAVNATGTLNIEIGASNAVLAGTFTGVAGTLNILNRIFDRWTIEPAGTLVGVHGSLHRVDATAADVTIDLPPSGPTTQGQKIAGKKTDGGANDVIMNPAGGDAIVGTDRTATAFGYIELVDNGDGTWSTGPVV